MKTKTNTPTKYQLRQAETARKVMLIAWQFIKKNALTKREAVRTAWQNVKVRKEMQRRVVEFEYTKKDGTIRKAKGTLQSAVVPATKGGRKECEAVQVYYDTEAQAWRSFRKANLKWYRESSYERERAQERMREREAFLIGIGVIKEYEEEFDEEYKEYIRY